MNKFYSTQQLHKDPVNGKVSGVCAGLARYWGQEAWLIRLGAIIALLMFPMATAVAYLMGVLLLRNG